MPPEALSGAPSLYRRQRRHAGTQEIALENFGYNVLTALSGGKGSEQASNCPIDVVILGYFIPEMNRQEIAVEIKRLKPHAPIIMLSKQWMFSAGLEVARCLYVGCKSNLPLSHDS
jgi:CheY-like chemotaxis protein